MGWKMSKAEPSGFHGSHEETLMELYKMTGWSVLQKTPPKNLKTFILDSKTEHDSEVSKRENLPK